MRGAWHNKCVDIDKRIARLRDMTARLRDQQMLDDIFSLIAELEAQNCELRAVPEILRT
jgi:hypothetical protein